MKSRAVRSFFTGILMGSLILLGTASIGVSLFERYYRGKTYPTVSVAGIPFGGKTPEEIQTFWFEQNEPFADAVFEFRVENKIATISALDVGLGYDATLSATQAYLVGRSGYLMSDLYTKFVKRKTDLSPLFRWDTSALINVINVLAEEINIPVQEALFQFSNGRVLAFRPSRDGRRVHTEGAIRRFVDLVPKIPDSETKRFTVLLPVEIIKPTITTDQVNSFGIKERIGYGYSEFAHSIPGRVHNVTLAASRLNGLLIKPGETFSFNSAVGDINAATGYQSAYIIKDGRTVLGDGGGVCQVSTTLFRAALNAGLPIEERRAHSYRVQYYEQAGYKPGLDATVFAPSVDLKIKNDTPAYVLIQTRPDPENYTLTFELYGTSDGRKAEILEHTVWGESPPPPAVYQDDPTLPAGAVRQVDFPAWGAQTSFRYTVTRNGTGLQDEIFKSSFSPWRAVYLRGTQ